MKPPVGAYTTPPLNGTVTLVQQHQQAHKNTSAKAATMHMHKSAGAIGPRVTGEGGCRGAQKIPSAHSTLLIALISIIIVVVISSRSASSRQMCMLPRIIVLLQYAPYAQRIFWSATPPNINFDY